METLEQKIEAIKKMKEPVMVIHPDNMYHALSAMYYGLPVKFSKWMDTLTFVIMDNALNPFKDAKD